jgi:hypothetical protein
MKFTVTNAGTVYTIYKFPGFYLVESGWGQGYGEWIKLDQSSVAWNYIAEKMPIMGKREGDKSGWIMAFAEAGLEVFG